MTTAKKKRWWKAVKVSAVAISVQTRVVVALVCGGDFALQALRLLTSSTILRLRLNPLHICQGEEKPAVAVVVIIATVVAVTTAEATRVVAAPWGVGTSSFSVAPTTAAKALSSSRRRTKGTRRRSGGGSSDGSGSERRKGVAV
jgi:hypothetical protein